MNYGIRSRKWRQKRQQQQYEYLHENSQRWGVRCCKKEFRAQNMPEAIRPRTVHPTSVRSVHTHDSTAL